jgi:hypothetical protein
LTEVAAEVVGEGLGEPSSMMIERLSSHLVPFQMKPLGQVSGVWVALFEAPQAQSSAARREHIVRGNMYRMSISNRVRQHAFGGSRCLDA